MSTSQKLKKNMCFAIFFKVRPYHIASSSILIVQKHVFLFLLFTQYYLFSIFFQKIQTLCNNRSKVVLFLFVSHASCMLIYIFLHHLFSKSYFISFVVIKMSSFFNNRWNQLKLLFLMHLSSMSTFFLFHKTTSIFTLFELLLTIGFF